MTTISRELKVASAEVFDRQLILALLLALLVLVPREILIIRAQSPCVDDNSHLAWGLMFLRNDQAKLHDQQFNDPSLGEALLAIPAWLNGVHIPDPLRSRITSGDSPPSAAQCFILPDTVREQTALWKIILFLPAIVVIFQWVRSVYSVHSAWLMLAMILSEPTLAAHLPIPALDVLGMEGIVIACWAAWRCIVRPTPARRLGAAAAVAMALLLKNTALIIPFVITLLAAIHWLIQLRLDRKPIELRHRLTQFVVTAAAVPVFMWIFLLGNVSPAALGPPFKASSPIVSFLNTRPIPCGLYLKSVYTSLATLNGRPRSYLLGEISTTGWWYYFPVVATYKMPLGIAGIILLGLISLIWRRPRYEETPLLICAMAWTTSLMIQHIDIGFRHFLPAEIFWLMLASRCVAVPRVWPTILAWAGVGLAFIHVALWTPDDLSYINFPRQAAYLDISDSNIDWGQGLKQLRGWIDSQPAAVGGIYVAYFGPTDLNLRDQIGPRPAGYAVPNGWRVHSSTGIDVFTPQMPAHGILIVSPVLLTGQHPHSGRFAFLKTLRPRDVIGHCLLVYDLDHLPAD